MPIVVKITEVLKEKTNDNKWHFIYESGGAPGALCSGQVYRFGDIDAKYQLRDGEITCPNCIKIIKMFKSVKI